MKIIRLFFPILLLCLLSSPVFSGTLAYNRANAIDDYASKFCQNYNTQDANNTKDIAYTSFGNDCANFVSQAMIAGGLNFSCVKDANPIGTGKKNKGELGEITVSQLKTQLAENFCFEVITDPSKAQNGDILSSNNGSHVVLYSGEQSYNFISNGQETTGTVREKGSGL